MYISIQCQLSVTRPYRSQELWFKAPPIRPSQCVISLMWSRMESSMCLLMWNTDTAMAIYRREIKRARNVQSDPDKLQHAMWVFLYCFFFFKLQMIWHVTTVHWTTGYNQRKDKRGEGPFSSFRLDFFFFFFCKYKNSAKYYTLSSLSALSGLMRRPPRK